MTLDERTERVNAARQRWEHGRRGTPLPLPEELAKVQKRLIAAAQKGKAEFNRVWEETFQGKYPSPGKNKFLPAKDVFRVGGPPMKTLPSSTPEPTTK